MTTTERWKKPRLLVILETPGKERVALPLLNAFQHVHVTLLGYHLVPEQMAPEHARDQFEEEAFADLDEAAEEMGQYDVEVETHLIFTSNLVSTIERVVSEQAIDALLHLRPLAQIRRVLVPLYGTQQQPEHVATFVTALARNETIEVRVRVLVQPHQTAEEKAELRQQQHGVFNAADVAAEQLDVQTVETDDPMRAIVELSDECDLIVLGEADPSLRERIFGQFHERLVPEVACPVVLVLYKPD